MRNLVASHQDFLIAIPPKSAPDTVACAVDGLGPPITIENADLEASPHRERNLVRPAERNPRHASQYDNSPVRRAASAGSAP
jgi:hypothetical protein